MPVDKSMTRNNSKAAIDRAIYETPRFGWQDLRVVTLGGSVGEGDSGAPGMEEPGPNGAREERFEEDWDD